MTKYLSDAGKYFRENITHVNKLMASVEWEKEEPETLDFKKWDGKNWSWFVTSKY